MLDILGFLFEIDPYIWIASFACFSLLCNMRDINQAFKKNGIWSMTKVMLLTLTVGAIVGVFAKILILFVTIGLMGAV